MKRTLGLMLALALLLAAVGASALAAGYVYFSGDCNVRYGPGLSYGLQGSVTRGSRLSYAGDTRYDSRGVAWYEVYYRGRTGWVSSVYANRTSYGGYSYRDDDYDYDYDDDDYDDYDDYDYDDGDTVQAVSGDTNVRSGPGLGYAILGTLYRYGTLSYAGDTRYDKRGVAWYSVYWNNRVAWVSSVFTSLY